MKKITFAFLFLLLAFNAFAFPPNPPSTSGTTVDPGGTGLIFCTYSGGCTFTAKAIGTDVQAYHASLASIAGLTETAGGEPYFTADNTWAVLAKGTAYQIRHMNSGATASEWTSTLGATGTRLTKGWFTDLEVTNDITIGGNPLATIYQPLDSTLTGLAGLAITVDGNNVTFPGAVITTAADGSRKLAVLANTVGVDAASDAFELYPDSDNTWKINQNGTEYTPTLSPTAGQVIFSGPDAARTKTVSNSNTTLADVDGALGTPSFTALNMPSSNSDPATTAGQIRHDSTDTNAASDGSIKVFTGNHVNTLVSATAVADDSYTIITKTEYIPIAYAEDGAAAPAAASVWADTRKAKIRVFAADADDDVEIHWMVPDDYVGGIKFRVVGFVDNATAPADTETVILNLAGCSVGNSDDGGCTLGTGVDSTFTADATYAQHDRWSSAWSNEITVTNIVAGESAMLKLFRDVDDTYGQGIGVAGIEIKYKARVLMADRY